MAMNGDRNNSQYSEFDREWMEFLNEIRVALPGVQFLFAFLLTVPFSDRFVKLSLWIHGIYLGCLLCTTGATVLLMAPTLYHRLHWRRDVVDKEEMLRTSNRLALAGTALLVLAMVSAVFVMSDLIFAPLVAWPVTGAVAIAFLWLWYLLPLSRRRRARRRR
jgi:hypothetical protein